MDSARKARLLKDQKESKVGLLRYFDRVHRNADDEKYAEHVAEQRAFYEEFIDHSERFQPTEQAYLNIFYKLYEETGDWYSVPRKIRLGKMQKKLDSGDLRNVFVTVSHKRSSQTNTGWESVLSVHAEYKGKDGTYKDASNGRIAFSISNFVERIPEPSLLDGMKNTFS